MTLLGYVAHLVFALHVYGSSRHVVNKMILAEAVSEHARLIE